MGFDPLFALTCATKNGAQMLGVDDVTGTLEAGKSADLLVLTADPLQDIRNLNVANMELIMKEGEVVTQK